MKSRGGKSQRREENRKEEEKRIEDQFKEGVRRKKI